MPAANHSFYLRNFYLDNKLTKGELEIAGVRLDLRKVTVPVYNLATREDHIAPAKSVLYGSQFFGGAGEIRAGRLRPHRRRDQSAGQARNISTGPGPSRAAPTSMPGGRRRPSIPARGGRTGWSGSKPKTPRPCRRARSAAANSRPIEDAPGSYVKVKSWT